MKLRKYQTALNKPALKFLKAIKGNRAQVYAPTGSGKTVCFNELLKKAIQLGKVNICIVHPRIALSQDQLQRFRNEFGTRVRTASFHSGKHIAGESTVAEIGTLSKDALLSDIEQSKTILSVPHVTFTTYNSYSKLLDIKFDIIIFDEAHYMVQDNFYSWIKDINADKILFYTATPITNELEDGYMMDFSLFGPIIASVLPKELIPLGYVVAPLVHRLEVSTNKRGDEVDIIDIVARAYVEQWNEMTSFGMPYHQMLVAARGVNTDLREIEDRLDELWNKISILTQGRISQVDVYTVEADGSYKNRIPQNSRSEALEEIKKSGKNCIIAHYDTLSEGIDIDTLSGVLLMRKMSKAKIIQMIGRCARPFIGDLNDKKEPRKEIFDLENGIDLRKKPRCIVTLPVIDGVWIANDNGTQVAEAFSLAGYEDLTTYLADKDDSANGKKKTGFVIAEDDTVASAALNHKLVKELEQLKKIFEY